VLTISSPTKRAQIKTGTYAGDGNDDRNINIGVDLAAKENAYVVVDRLETGGISVHRIEYSQGDLTMKYDSGVDVANEIQSFTSTGFQVGSGDFVNQDANTYRYIVFWEDP
jgi:hypothetical protein